MNPLLERRMALMRISPQFLIDMCKPGRHGWKVMDGLPSDAVVLDVSFDHERRCFALAVASATFAPVPDGLRLPDVECSFMRVDE